MFASKLMEKYGEGHSEMHRISVALERAHGSMWEKNTVRYYNRNSCFLKSLQVKKTSGLGLFCVDSTLCLLSLFGLLLSFLEKVIRITEDPVLKMNTGRNLSQI